MTPTLMKAGRMTQHSHRSQRASGDTNRHVSVETVAQLANRHLDDEQLIDLLTRLELELVTRAAPPDDLVLTERPAVSQPASDRSQHAVVNAATR